MLSRTIDALRKSDKGDRTLKVHLGSSLYTAHRRIREASLLERPAPIGLERMLYFFVDNLETNPLNSPKSSVRSDLLLELVVQSRNIACEWICVRSTFPAYLEHYQVYREKSGC